MLRQEFEPRSRAELDALADALVEMALAVDDPIASDEASWALRFSQKSESEGVPYDGALDALVRIYETRVERLVGDAEDPFREMAVGRLEGSIAEHHVFLAGKALSMLRFEEGGRDYLRELVESGELPPACLGVIPIAGEVIVIDFTTGEVTAEKPPPRCPAPRGSTWCRAGYLLFDRYPNWNRREDGPNPAAPELFYEGCDGPFPRTSRF